MVVGLPNGGSRRHEKNSGPGEVVHPGLDGPCDVWRGQRG